MKRFMILTILLLFMVGCVGCNNQTPPDVTDPITDPTADPTTEPTTDPSTTTDPSLYENNARIYVNGVELFSERKYYNEELQEYELPFLAIMKGLGFTVDWRSDEEVFIVSEDVTYILNPTEGTIIDPASPERGSLFLDPPGGGPDSFKFSFLNQEFYINKLMLDCFFEIDSHFRRSTGEFFIGETPEPLVFPVDPNEFNPIGLEKSVVNDPYWGMTITWFCRRETDPNSIRIVFQWKENKNKLYGQPCYYVNGGTTGYIPGKAYIPTTEARVYFGW